MAREERASAFDDVELLALGVELDEVRRPGVLRVLVVERGDRDGFAVAAVVVLGAELVQLARAAEREAALADGIRHRGGADLQIEREVQGPAGFEMRARHASRLVGDDVADAAGERERVHAEIGADVDRRHVRLEPGEEEVDLLLEPALLLEKDVGGDGFERVGHVQERAVFGAELQSHGLLSVRFETNG